MANSQLIDKSYKIPDKIINYIKSVLVRYPNNDGVRRAKFITNNGKLTYQALKRIKHDLENSTNKIQYALSGGEEMLNYINSLLGIERKNIDISKETKQDSTVDLNLAIHAQQNPELD